MKSKRSRRRCRIGEDKEQEDEEQKDEEQKEEDEKS